jgi:hypothetical protein
MNFYNNNLQQTHGNLEPRPQNDKYWTSNDFLGTNNNLFNSSDSFSSASLSGSFNRTLEPLEGSTVSESASETGLAGEASLGPAGAALYAAEKLNSTVNTYTNDQNLNEASRSPYFDAKNVASIANNDNLAKGGNFLQDITTFGTSNTQGFSSGEPGFYSGVPQIPTVQSTSGGLTTAANAD